MSKTKPVGNLAGDRMRVLITGGCGFVGSQVAREAAARGQDVTTADLNHTRSDVDLDIRDAALVDGAVHGHDVVVHCAAVVGPGPARENSGLAVDVNIHGTANVLEAARRHGARVVYLSTATLYGMRPDLKPLYETDPPSPVSHYDATKYAAEVICRSYRSDFDVDVICIRTGFVYGPGHSTGEYFVEPATRGEAVRVETGGDGPCDFTYVKDLAKGLVSAAERSDLPAPVYNVTGGVHRTRSDFAQAVRNTLPDADIEIGPGIDPAMHLRGPCIPDLAKRDFGYVPAFTIEEGIRDWVNEVLPTASRGRKEI
ncbi:MAG: hypothetical protein CME19_05105 [Gemmatimonadetes bacterium]|nr:hypothetical protein [Gemmatimonadota bacterium]